MNAVNIYPLLFKPVYKDYIWGGRRIPELYDRNTDQQICAESWEVSDRDDGMSIITNGPLAGKSLHEAVKQLGKNLVGSACPSESFPLLIKLIDAKQNLSVQVHPNDETAIKYGGEAKTECWLSLSSDGDPCVYAGLHEGTTPESFRKAIEDADLEKMIYKIKAIEGETIYIPGGRVHAIAAGCLLLEVQQNSNTTYRVYDWGRVGHDGRPRELHIDKAFEVINWNDTAPEPHKPVQLNSDGPNSWFELIKSPYFHLKRLDLTFDESLKSDGQSFRILFLAEGNAVISGETYSEKLSAGTSCLIPAGIEECALTPDNGPATIISITL